MIVFLWMFSILSCLWILGKLFQLSEGDGDGPFLVIFQAVAEIAMLSWALALLFGR